MHYIFLFSSRPDELLLTSVIRNTSRHTSSGTATLGSNLRADTLDWAIWRNAFNFALAFIFAAALVDAVAKHVIIVGRNIFYQCVLCAQSLWFLVTLWKVPEDLTSFYCTPIRIGWFRRESSAAVDGYCSWSVSLEVSCFSSYQEEECSGAVKLILIPTKNLRTNSFLEKKKETTVKAALLSDSPIHQSSHGSSSAPIIISCCNMQMLHFASVVLLVGKKRAYNNRFFFLLFRPNK